MCASIGHEVPLWDSQDGFGDTALLVNSMEMGRDLAKRLGKGAALLMRGHGAVVASGSIRQAVFVSVYLERNAISQMQAMAMVPDQVPEQGRGRRGDRAHRSLYARSRLGRFRPPGRAEGGGVSRPVTASI